MAPSNESPFKRIGIIGAGAMGSMMALGLAEHGFLISIWDISSANVRSVMEKSQQSGQIKEKITGFYDIGAFADSFGNERKLCILSTSHGTPADEVLNLLNEKDAVKTGDIILDGGNEHWRTTERRQKSLKPKGVEWIGLGVSGGYQAARRGPSLCPGGDRKTIEEVMPVLENFAAKYELDGKQRPCVEFVGPGGAGHFVKMAHNGIENGMLGAICEAWSWMQTGMGMSEDEIGDVFKAWNAKGELYGTYLLQIGSDICHQRKRRNGDGDVKVDGGGLVLDEVLDKVVQDDDDTEGTGYWSVMEAAAMHVSAPTIAAAQFLRVASGNREQRLKVAKKLSLGKPQKIRMSTSNDDQQAMIEELRRAVYVTVLVSFCQGLELIAHASKIQGWNVDLATCIRIWRAGCIIQSGHIANLLEPIFTENSRSDHPYTIANIKLIQEVADELNQNFAALKETVLEGVASDAYMPTMSASLEYLKYESGDMLPTQFMEAEMDFFGAHGFDNPGVMGEDPGKAKKGAHHYEWQPA